MKKGLVIGAIVGLAAVAVLAMATMNTPADTLPPAQISTSAATEKPKAMGSAPSEKPAASEPAATRTAPYVEYAAAGTAPQDRPYRVLFFKADWCYTCTGLHDDIEANSSQVPADVQIIRVDYDKETQLKQKYDVRQQHTLVQIDPGGNVVKKWVLSPTLQHVTAQIKRS